MLTINSTIKPLKSYFPDIYFNEKYHTYTLDNKNYPSVSKKIKDFHLPFDRSVAKWSAKKRKITTKEMLQEWDRNRDESLLLGNRVHAFGENYLKADVTKADTMKPTCNKELGIVQFMLDLDPKYEVVAVELIMYNTELKYAGTTDFILHNTETNKYVIGDWKTNKDVNKSYGNKLLKPFHNLLETPLNKYKIQLNFYQMALESVGLEVEERWVVWLNQNKSKYYKVFKVADYTNKLKSFYKT